MLKRMKRAFLMRLAKALAPYLIGDMTDLLRQRARRAHAMKLRAEGKDHTMRAAQDRAEWRDIERMFPFDDQLTCPKVMKVAAANPARTATQQPLPVKD